MTRTFSTSYPVEGGPSKWDLMLALFDRERGLGKLTFTFGTKPLDLAELEEGVWSLAMVDPPATIESQVWVIGVESLVSKGDHYHIKAHVTVPRHLILGCRNDTNKKTYITMLAGIFFSTNNRKGSVVFMMTPD